MTTFSKPLKEDRAHISGVIFSSYKAVVEVLDMLPRHEAIRREVINYVHRLFDLSNAETVLPAPAAAPHTVSVLGLLLKHSDSASIHVFIGLLDEMMIKAQ